MNVDYKLIGLRIREQRRALGKTQEKLAEFLSVSVGYVSQVERGVTKVSLDTLCRISSFLSCDPSIFLSGSVPQQKNYLHNEFENTFHRLNERQKKMLMDMIHVIVKY